MGRKGMEGTGTGAGMCQILYGTRFGIRDQSTNLWIRDTSDHMYYVYVLGEGQRIDQSTNHLLTSEPLWVRLDPSEATAREAETVFLHGPSRNTHLTGSPCQAHVLRSIE